MIFGLVGLIILSYYGQQVYLEVQDYWPPMHYAYMKKSNEQSGSVIFRPTRLIILYYN